MNLLITKLLSLCTSSVKPAQVLYRKPKVANSSTDIDPAETDGPTGVANVSHPESLLTSIACYGPTMRAKHQHGRSSCHEKTTSVRYTMYQEGWKTIFYCSLGETQDLSRMICRSVLPVVQVLQYPCRRSSWSYLTGIGN